MIEVSVPPFNETNAHGTPVGKVCLIGAGPGDPELMTIKGLRYLRIADVVLYDRLVSLDVLDEAPPKAELVYVGKRPRQHALAQSEINELMIAYAREGRMVVRLKGGDPFVFGRGGEEVLALIQAGIPFEVVPGISSALAVPASAGIPLTHRDYASSVTIVTGHEAHESDKDQGEKVDWPSLARLGGTLVVLMGVKTLPAFARRLQNAGLSPDLPAAVIQEGTTSRQRVVTGTLADIAERAQAAGLSSPAVTVIGNVVEALALEEAALPFTRTDTGTDTKATARVARTKTTR